MRKHLTSSLSGFKSLMRVLALAALVAVSGGLRLAAQEATALEYQVKAAFLVRFASFVEWPADARFSTNESFNIGILGEDPFGSNFDEAVQPERVNRRRVTVRRGRDFAELEDCQIIFIGVSESQRLEELLQSLADKRVLVVGEDAEFAKRGGMIGFIKENGKVRFEINVAAAERAGLKLSAKLLQVGRIVVPGKSRGAG